MSADFMRRAIALGLENVRTGRGGPFAALVVKDGSVVAEGANRVTTTNDPTAHAEVVAIREACRRLGDFQLSGCDLYTTCEPCPMCMACALWARMDRVVYGATIADAARFGHQIQIPATELVKRSDMTCIVDGPIERDACFALFTDPNMQKTFKLWNSEKP
jgi:guanine deaminase